MSIIKKSIWACIAISLWVYVLLKIWNPIWPFLFALWLLMVCVMDLNLYTWKCGYVIEQKNYKNLAIILIVNLVIGYLLWWLLSLCNDPDVIAAAISKISSRDLSLAFFIKSVFCGIIMFVAVDLYKKWTKLWIIFWVPLFIFCGFQHCIANVITMGVAHVYSNSIRLAVLWNIVWSLFVRYFVSQKSLLKNK